MKKSLYVLQCSVLFSVLFYNHFIVVVVVVVVVNTKNLTELMAIWLKVFFKTETIFMAP